MTFRMLRVRTGFSQFELAATTRALRSPVRQETISQLELGRVRDPLYSTVRSLALAMNLSVEVVGDTILRQRLRNPRKAKRRRRGHTDVAVAQYVAQVRAAAS